jgi:hypothetical protein
MVNFNAADIEDCCVGDLTAKIAGNGTDSDNTIDYEGGDQLTAFQNNVAGLNNDLDVDGDTGDNDVEDNTGAVDAASDPYLQTGNSDSDTSIHNQGGLNTFGNVDVEFDLSDLWGWFNSLVH